MKVVIAMARFVFRLARVKQIREIQEEQKMLVWTQAQNLLRLAQEKLDNLEKEKIANLDYCYQLSDLMQRLWVYQYIEKLDRLIVIANEELAEAAEKEAKARQKWLLARQEKEKLVRLEEKQYAEFNYQQSRLEQSQLDDMKNSLAQI